VTDFVKSDAVYTTPITVVLYTTVFHFLVEVEPFTRVYDVTIMLYRCVRYCCS